MKKKLVKEEVAKKEKEEQEKRDLEKEQERQIEDAFLTEEKQAIQKEHADKVKTKRLIDRMLVAEKEHVNEEVCSLLSNFGGMNLPDRGSKRDINIFLLINVGYFGNLVRNSRQHNDAVKALEKRFDNFETGMQKLMSISLENREMIKGFQRFIFIKTFILNGPYI